MEPTAAAEAHASRVVARDVTARAALAPAAPIEPGNLYDRLLAGPFRRFELVAHARIGAHHIFKTRYVGPTTLVVQERWVRGDDGAWRIHEAELARVATEDEG
jgi:hypothetical protein